MGVFDKIINIGASLINAAQSASLQQLKREGVPSSILNKFNKLQEMYSKLKEIRKTIIKYENEIKKIEENTEVTDEQKSFEIDKIYKQLEYYEIYGNSDSVLMEMNYFAQDLQDIFNRIVKNKEDTEELNEIENEIDEYIKMKQEEEADRWKSRYETSEIEELSDEEEGNIAFNKADYKNAIYYYEKAIESGNKNVKGNLGIAYNRLGVQKGKSDNYEEAIEYYKKAIEYGNEKAKENLKIAHNNLAIQYNNLGIQKTNSQDYEEAVKYLEKAIELLDNENIKGNLSVAYNNLGLQKSKAGDYEKAEEYYRKAIENKNFETYDNLINLYKEINNKEQLKAMLEEIKNSDEDIPEEIVKRADIEIIKLAIPQIITFVVILLIIKFIFFK